jgi:LacI family transcriptional regulator
MTVSQVVNGNGYVSAKTKRQVESAIAALGYRPNALAKGMRTNSTRSVGFILPSLIDMTNAAVAQAAEQFVARHGYRLVLGITGFSPDLEAQFLSSFQQNTVDGVIAILGDQTLHRIRDLVQQSRVPIVVVDHDLPFPSDTVLTEHRRCISYVVIYLSGLGHRRGVHQFARRSAVDGRLAGHGGGRHAGGGNADVAASRRRPAGPGRSRCTRK